METKSDFWVAFVLEAVERGESLNAALAQVPRAALPEVQAALEAADWLREEARPTLEAAAARWTPPPLPALDARERSHPPSHPLRRLWEGRVPPRALRPVVVAVTLLVLVVLSWQTSLAAAQALPGEWAYPLKRVGEQVQYALTTDPADRLTLTLRLAHRRLEEATLAQQRHWREAEEQSMALYAGALEEVARQWAALPPPRQEALRPVLVHALTEQAHQLEALHADTPDTTWQQAMRAHRVLWQAASKPQGVPEATPTLGGENRAHGGATPSPLPPATATPTVTPTASDDQPRPAATATCVSDGHSHGQNQCVPPSQKEKGNNSGNGGNSNSNNSNNGGNSNGGKGNNGNSGNSNGGKGNNGNGDHGNNNQGHSGRP